MLTTITLTQNSSRTIEKCLESIKWCKNIVIIDSNSTDNTLQICKKYTDKIYQHSFENYGEQLNWALAQINNEWVLVVDSDEEVSEKLRDEIIRISDLRFRVSEDGYYIPRKTNFLGKWIYHSGWYPDYVLRLFKKEGTKYKKRKLGSSPVIEGKKGYLKNEFLHYPYANLKHYLEKSKRYALLSAEQMKEEGRRSTIFGILFKPTFKFIKDYFFRRGFLDGKQGVIICTLSARYVFMRYVTLRQIQKDIKN
jgi:glycosyltransferase involved in cell wall biosynthesis